MNAPSLCSAGSALRAAILGALVFSGGAAWSQAPVDCLAAATPIGSIDMKLLVVAGDGSEVVFPAIKATLDYLGIPYDTLIASNTVLTQEMLCSGADGTGRARYQGVLLTTGTLVHFDPATNSWPSALSAEEWNRLWKYEAKYRVRQATFYTSPQQYWTPTGTLDFTYGLRIPATGVDTTGTPLSTTLTAPGKQVFSYLNTANPVRIQYAYTYLSPSAQTSASPVTPLVVDSQGNAIVSIVDYPVDGRKNLTVTADGNPSLLHTVSLGYGIVNWVTKGLYVGQRKVYMSAQPDDVMIADDIWNPATNSDTSGKLYRITGSDYSKLMAWQNNVNATTRNAANIKLEHPFNGFGTDPTFPPEELYPATTDDLTPTIYNDENGPTANSTFNWLSHTYTHFNLDSPTTYAQTLSELRQNDSVATDTIGFTFYNKDSLITPDVSGLNNAEALRAMKDFGIRYVVSNTSIECGNRSASARAALAKTANTYADGCPKPNTGIYNDVPTPPNTTSPAILMIPRYPANLFYNVCRPAEWVSEYNFIYRSFWGRDLSYNEILDKESEIWMRYMLNHDMRPVMFHQPNLCGYDGGSKSLLGDLIDTTMQKYNGVYNLPVWSRRQRQIGALMAERMNLNNALKPVAGAPLTARIVPNGTTSNVVLTNPTAKAVVVPVTGVSAAAPATKETYGGQTTSKVAVGAGGATVTVTGAPAW